MRDDESVRCEMGCDLRLGCGPMSVGKALSQLRPGLAANTTLVCPEYCSK
jgi:hypothetical protein